MILYFMRHAEAVLPEKWDGPDSTRPLTSKGEKLLRAAVSEMTKDSFCPTHIIHSPFVRARQTADIVAKSFPAVLKMDHPSLAAGAAADAVRTAVLDGFQSFSASEGNRVLVIGHVPDLIVAAARLVGEAHLLESRMLPGEVFGVETTGDLKWGSAKLLWKKTLEDWA